MRDLRSKYFPTGYQKGSPDFYKPYNIINSGKITMEGVPFEVLGIDEYGNTKIMKPGGEYQFEGNIVKEIPIRQHGGEIPKYQDGSWNFLPTPYYEPKFETPIINYGDGVRYPERIEDINFDIRGDKPAYDILQNPPSELKKLIKESGNPNIEIGRGNYYNPFANNINVRGSSMYKRLIHELMHARQRERGELLGPGITMAHKPPSIVDVDKDNHYNRQETDYQYMQDNHDNLFYNHKLYGGAQFMPPQLIRDKFNYRGNQYYMPGTIEHQTEQETFDFLNEHGIPQKKHGGEIPKFQFDDFNTGDQGFKAFPVSTPGTPPSNLNVADLQQALVDKEYDLDVDGILGPLTIEAFNDAIFTGPRQESNLSTIGPEIKTPDNIRFVDRPKTSFFDKPDGTGRAYKDVLLTLSDEYGKSPAELMAYYDYVANHETFGKKNKRSVKQDEGGPGRGVTQLEKNIKEDEKRGAHVAADKLYWFNNQHGIEQPKWLIDFRKSKYKDVVDEGLSLDQQAALTFAHDFLVSDNNRNISYKNMSKYDNFYDKDQSKNIWLDNHWKGKDKDRQARIDSFNLHNENYLLPDRLIYKYGGKIYQGKTKSMKPKKLYGTNSNPFNMKKGGIIPKFEGLAGSSFVGDTSPAVGLSYLDTPSVIDTTGSMPSSLKSGNYSFGTSGYNSAGEFINNDLGGTELNVNTKPSGGNKSGNAMSGISSALSSFNPGQMISSVIEKKGDEMLGDWANLGRSTDPRLMKGANRANKVASGLHAAGSAAMSTNPIVGVILNAAGVISSGIGLKKAKKAMAYGGMDKDYMDRMTQEGEYYTPSQNIMPYSAPMNVGPSYGYAEYGGTVPYYEYDEMMDNLSGDYDDLTPDQINYLRSQGYEIEEI